MQFYLLILAVGTWIMLDDGIKILPACFAISLQSRQFYDQLVPVNLECFNWINDTIGFNQTTHHWFQLNKTPLSKLSLSDNASNFYQLRMRDRDRNKQNKRNIFAIERKQTNPK